MYKFIFLAILFVIGYQASNGQGCVAIRGTGSVCTKQDASHSAKGWQLNTSYRYFKSFRHFVGKEEQHERMENNTEVINWQHTINFGLVRQFNNRWSMSIDVPVISNV